MIVLDANVLSELARPDSDAAVLAWVAARRRAELCTTAISEAAPAYGLALLPKGRRRDARSQATARLFSDGLGGRVLPFDRAAAAAYGEFVARRRAVDIPHNDACVAFSTKSCATRRSAPAIGSRRCAEASRPKRAVVT